MNNLDIAILITIGLSVLIALSRGLVKEVLSIVGWVLGVVAVICLLPVLTPIAGKFIVSGLMAGIVTAIVVLIVFLVCWILLTGQLIGKIRSSKLNGLDRILGMFFGFLRAFLLIILFNILVTWMIPKEEQSDTFKKSKYFQIAGDFAEPIEKLIPKSTLEGIKAKVGESGLIAKKEDKKEEAKENKADKENDELFNKLTQPQIKKKEEEKKIKELEIKTKHEAESYNHDERKELNDLIKQVE